MRTSAPTVAAVLLALPLFAVRAAGQRGNVSGGELIAEEACYDVLHYDLVLTVDPVEKAIEGVLTMRARTTAAAARIALDLDPALTVRSVQLDGSPLPFAHTDGRIWLEPVAALPAERVIEVAVAYGGKPHVAINPPWRGGFTWSETADGKPWIATSCQGEGADLWWPCKDHPSDKPDGIDLHVTVPVGLVVASNGTEPEAPVTANGRTTFHWRLDQPFSNYAIALAIAPYVELTDTFRCSDGTEMPVRFFVLPASVDHAKRCMPQFLDHVRVFEQILGPYPFRAAKYGIAETPFLGMEHETILAYGNRFRDEQYDWLHVHELAHEWWGNLVTCRDWRDMWLHEGFATYMQALYRERRFGQKAYDDEIRKARTLNRAPIAPRDSKTTAEIYFAGGGGSDIYQKGALVLHTLRWQLGDEPFFACLHRFCYPTPALERATDGSQVRLVDTDEFVRLVSAVAGEDLAWFFEAYVRQAALPRLTSEIVGDELRLRWVTPGELRFEVPVPVLVGGEEVRVSMPANRGVLAVGEAKFVIDPEVRVLKVQDKTQRR
ncbi:MAG: M1 family metallopeptidase [Planctomycetes bacterium]|nr:M1 family metallopeptidase [Planctomycetota bacterium]